MITKEQKQKIIYDLLAKNLPLDLLVEIKDHMEEQLEHKIDIEEKSFEAAYEEVKKSWEKDLRMVYAFRLPRKKITILHKKINHKTEKEILLKSLKYFLPFLAITLLLSLYSKELTQNIFLVVYSIIGISGVVTAFYFNNILKTAGQSEKRNISIYQRGSFLFYFGGLYVFIFNLVDFYERFDRFYRAISDLYFLDFKNFEFFPIFYTYIFVFFWLFGLFYFLNYRKTIKELQQKINLKL